MDTEKTIKKKLKLIRKNGDLYDVISRKRNATPDTFLRKLVKAHTLVFSRILYLYLVLVRRIKNSFSSVSSIKDAQDEIRAYLGVPVDIIKNKDIYVREKNKELGILYGDYHAAIDGRGVVPSIEDLKKDLERILNFCSLYEIDEIYIDERFLRKYLSKEFLLNFEHIFHSKILSYEFIAEKSFLNIRTSLNGLKLILSKLRESNYDNEYILTFKDRINDQIIKDAIDTFAYDNDASKLLMIVKSRLNLHFNEEGVVKDRVHGKLYESYEIGGPYIRVTTLDSKGNLINKTTISLYSYFEVNDYSGLDMRTNRITDDKELAQIALLYLHLLGEKPKEEKDSNNIYSIYDYIYDEYKKSKRKQQIPWINTRLQRLLAESAQFIVAFYSVVLAFVFALLLKFIPNHLFSDSPFLNKYNSFLDGIKSTYGASYEMERNIIKRIKQTVEKFLPKNMADEIINYAQEEMDSNGKSEEPKKVAEIEWFTEEKVPLYFMDKYADDAYFYDGKFKFRLSDSFVKFVKIENLEPLFQVSVPIIKSEFENIDEEAFFNVPLEVYPVGNNYAITKIIINDEADMTKKIVIDEKWCHNYLWNLYLSADEKEILKSMERPIINYVYGLSDYNSQVSFDKRNYTEEIDDIEAKHAILEGLDLDDNATRDEINESIASKGYTKYPLYTPTEETSELEFYKKIASLDNIDINIAAILTTVANDDFIYMVGYKNSNEDDYILTNESYVWAMNDEGEIIDFLGYFLDDESVISSSVNELDNNSYDNWSTDKEDVENFSINKKSKNEENKSDMDSKIKEVLNRVRLWALENHIPYYLVAVLAVLIIEKMFRRKIQLKIKFKNAYKILNDENLSYTYADLFKFVYGEKCYPIERTPKELLDLLSKQFRTIDEEKIDTLLLELKPLIKESDNPDSLKRVEKLLKNLPFIVERENELKGKVLKR